MLMKNGKKHFQELLTCIGCLLINWIDNYMPRVRDKQLKLKTEDTAEHHQKENITRI